MFHTTDNFRGLNIEQRHALRTSGFLLINAVTILLLLGIAPAWLARDPELGHIPVIMCTSKTQETDRIWGLRQGARDYVTKPIEDFAVLDHAVGKALEGTHIDAQ